MWNEIVFSIGCIILGIIFYLFSEISTVTIGIILGIYFLAMGIVKIYAYFNRKQIPLFHYNLFYGIISIILGIITIFEPFTFTKVVTTMIGIWLIYVAIVKIDLSIRLKMIGEKSWLFLLISALLVIFMGIVLIVNPFNNLLLTQIIGSFLILFGVVHSTDAFLIKKELVNSLKI